jgi:hypothetical protein
MRTTLIRIAALALVIASANLQASTALKDAVTVDAGFAYATEQDLWIDLSVYDIEGAHADHRVVEVLEQLDGAEVRVIEKGLTDATGSFQRQIRVPATAGTITVRVGVFGISNSVEVALDGSGTLTHTFE